MLIQPLLFAVLSAAPQVAKPNAPAAVVSEAQNKDIKKARELFQTGQKLYKQARYAEAISKFEEANVLRSHPVTYFNIGKCYQQLGETGKSLRAFRDYLRLAPDATDKDSVLSSVATLERRLREKGVQQLLIFVEPPSAQIAVDGKALGVAPASVELAAGNHVLVVSAEGYEKIERTFAWQTAHASEMSLSLRVQPQGTVLVADAPVVEKSVTAVELTPPPVLEASAAPSKKRVWTYVAGGAAVASLGVAIGCGVSALSLSAENEKTVHDNKVEANQAEREIILMRDASNVSYAVAGAAAVTAAILFFVEK